MAAGRARPVTGAAAPRPATADSRSSSSPPTAARVLAKPAGHVGRVRLAGGFRAAPQLAGQDRGRASSRPMAGSWRPKATGRPRCGNGTAPRSGTSRFRCSARRAWRIGFLTAFSPDGGLVAATDPGDDIGLWETRTRQRRQVLRRLQPLLRPQRPGPGALLPQRGGDLSRRRFPGRARPGPRQPQRELPFPEAVGYRRPGIGGAAVWSSGRPPPRFPVGTSPSPPTAARWRRPSTGGCACGTRPA